MLNLSRSEKSIFVHMMEQFLTTEAYSLHNMTSQPEDISELPTNAEDLRVTRLIVQRILVPIIVTLGLSGNLISIIVLTRPSMKSSTNCYLTFLAVFDSLYLVTSFTLSLKHYPSVNFESGYNIWYAYGRVLADMWSNASVILTVTFTVERYIAVCHPMKGRVICTPKRARIIALVVACSALVCTSPEFFEFKVVTVQEANSTVLKIKDTELTNQKSYSVGYNYFIAFAFTFVPLMALCTFNAMLIKSVCKANDLRRTMTNAMATRSNGSNDRRHWEQHKTTIMLISVSVVFIICQLPSASMIIFWTYQEIFNIFLSRFEINNIKMAGNISNLLILINASINFLLYSAMSTKFRRVFFRVLYRISRCRNRTSLQRHGTFSTGISFSKSTGDKYIRSKSIILTGRSDERVSKQRNVNSNLYDSCENLNESSDSLLLNRICQEPKLNHQKSDTSL